MRKVSEVVIQSKESKIKISGENYTMSFYDEEEIIQVFNNKDECVFVMKPMQPTYKEFIKEIEVEDDKN